MPLSDFGRFSPKQLTVLTWWCDNSPHRTRDAILCDGAVRSGKTVCMTLSFVLWAFYRFPDASFALCGKTIASLRRNILTPMLPLLRELGFDCDEKVSRNLVEIRRGSVTHRFYLFGGKDEGSAALIQGMTLGGVLMDEVALMPRSFVEQAMARCSVQGAKLWFNCNPENPYHWFYREWVQKAEQKNCLYLHFTMQDNPSLSADVRRRYENLYSGAFYERFIRGRWVNVSGLVYPMFRKDLHVASLQGTPCRCFISCDYGTVNPSSFGLWGLGTDGVWTRMREYYHDSRRTGVQRTDEEHYEGLTALAGDLPIEAVVVDPSAASFMECIRRHGAFRVLPADNDVLDGIRKVSCALKDGKIRIDPSCTDTLREFSLYRWDENSVRDVPKKQNDHAMDDLRYFVTTVMQKADGGFFSVAVER
ncbi:MAG: PBSX family phage terminase large subunit [Clostridia bacterium]|nr:PBSX family phage terminase large subunit [Clostridia bacterium]